MGVRPSPFAPSLIVMRNYPIAFLVGIHAILFPLEAANLERVSLTRAQFFYEQSVGQLAAEEKFAVRGAYQQARLTNNALLLQSGFQNVGYTAVRFAAPDSTPAVESVEQWPGILNRYEGSLAKAFTYIPA